MACGDARGAPAASYASGLSVHIRTLSSVGPELLPGESDGCRQNHNTLCAANAREWRGKPKN